MKVGEVKEIIGSKLDIDVDCAIIGLGEIEVAIDQKDWKILWKLQELLDLHLPAGTTYKLAHKDTLNKKLRELQTETEFSLEELKQFYGMFKSDLPNFYTYIGQNYGMLSVRYLEGEFEKIDGV